MRIQIDVMRRVDRGQQPYLQSFFYETADESETVAVALTRLNDAPERRDTAGRTAEPIQWECSCMQKKCGACAMVVNGKPKLACDARLSDCGPHVLLEPLRKFPVIADLVVDRSILLENLKTVRLWLEETAEMSQKAASVSYDASRCLQCGCCLEVCPNFYPGGPFAGPAAAVPMTRLLAELSPSRRQTLGRLYQRHIYEGCGKSLACRNICPAGIEIDRLLVHSNAAAVWKRRL